MNRTEQDAVPVAADDADAIEQSTRHPEHFGIIFDRHARAIRGYLVRRLGDELADDLTAETFLIAFRTRHRYSRDRRDARPWLYGIATNLIARNRRAEARHVRLLRTLPSDAGPADHQDRVADAMSAYAVRQSLITALARLAPAERDVLLLLAWEQMTYEEIANALSIPVGTVRSRLNRARAKVRDALQTLEEQR